MSILSLFEDTGEITAVLDPHETITRRLTPPYLRRPLALAQTADRTSFALVGGTSGELPMISFDRERPDETARIVVGRLVDAEPDPAETARLTWTAPPVVYGTGAGRPWFYRGRYRWTRSRALLFAALGGEGGSL